MAEARPKCGLPEDIRTNILMKMRTIELDPFRMCCASDEAVCKVATARRFVGLKEGIDVGVSAFIDAEHTLDPSYARRLGVEIDALRTAHDGVHRPSADVSESSGLAFVTSIEVMCPRCARPVAATPAASVAGNASLCRRAGKFVPPMEREEATTECDIAAAAYTRGIDYGIELAKAYILASVSNEIYPRPILNWTDVDTAAEKAKGGVE